MIKLVALIGLVLTGYLFYQSPGYVTIAAFVLMFAIVLAIWSAHNGR